MFDTTSICWDASIYFGEEIQAKMDLHGISLLIECKKLHLVEKMRRSSTKNIAFVGVFAALHAVLYLMSFGLWAVYLEPIEGIVLGPWAGLSAALIGSIAPRKG